MTHRFIPEDHPDDPYAALQGCQYSGETTIAPGQPRRALLRPRNKTGATFGLASVSIDERTVAEQLGESPANQRTLVHLSWKTGNSGGDATVDATRGSMFTISATENVEADVEIANIIDGGTFGNVGQASFTKRVGITCHWGGSVNPKPAYLTSYRIQITAGVPTALFLIPRYARAVIVLSPTPANLPGLLMNFHTDNGTTPTTNYQTLDPNANGTPIVHGSEYISLNHPTANMFAVLCWELWL